MDLGGGRGYLAKHILAETVHNLRVYDISQSMLDQTEGTPGVKLEKVLLEKEVLDVRNLKSSKILFNLEILASKRQSRRCHL